MKLLSIYKKRIELFFAIFFLGNISLHNFGRTKVSADKSFGGQRYRRTKVLADKGFGGQRFWRTKLLKMLSFKSCILFKN